MDAFESIVARILEKNGYWVHQSVKISCTPDEKATFGARSAPTPEIDLVAFNGFELVLFEVKSFLDSDGVRLNGVTGVDADDGKKYKILNNVLYQELVTPRVMKAFHVPNGTKVRYGLAAGNIYPPDLKDILEHFRINVHLKLLTPDYLATELIALGNSVYVNDEVWMTIKLLDNQNKITRQAR
jgi:hypothetical protein